MGQQSSPSNPPSGHTALFAGTDGLLRQRTAGGEERVLPSVSYVDIAADLSAYTSTTLTDMTGLGLTVEANTKYTFEYKGSFTTAATTTGMVVSLNGPAVVSGGLRASIMVQTASSAIVAGAITSYNSPITGTGSQGASSHCFFSIEGTIEVGASGGTLIPRYASEVSGSGVTVRAHSFGQLLGKG